MDEWKQVIERMRRVGFNVVTLETAAEVKQYLLEHIDASKSVGVGGSVTVRDVDILPALREKGCVVCDPWTADNKDDGRDQAARADVYLSSANAVTREGALVFIDGTGNRVSAIAYGPREVFFIISRAKLVDGGIRNATARIKKTACPPNARRLGLQTPCATTGLCKEPECADGCMCRMTLQLDRVPRGREMTVIFVDEGLGY